MAPSIKIAAEGSLRGRMYKRTRAGGCLARLCPLAAPSVDGSPRHRKDMVLMPLERSNTNPWRTVSSATVYRNSWFAVRQDQVVRQADGMAAEYTAIDWPYPIVSVLPVDEQGNVYLVRQWRYAWGEESWEAPAGRAEAGESPLEAAQRELAEEVGFAATEWIPLGCVRNSAQIDVQIYLFLARALQPAVAERDAEEADLIRHAVPLEEAVAAVMSGEIVHTTSIATILMAARFLEGEG